MSWPVPTGKEIDETTASLRKSPECMKFLHQLKGAILSSGFDWDATTSAEHKAAHVAYLMGLATGIVFATDRKPREVLQ